jgi:hypothetical protein
VDVGLMMIFASYGWENIGLPELKSGQPLAIARAAE